MIVEVKQSYIVLKKNSYPQKYLIWYTAYIRAFIKVIILKIAEILEYEFFLMQAVTGGEQYCMLVEVAYEMKLCAISSHLEPPDLIMVKNGYLNHRDTPVSC